MPPRRNNDRGGRGAQANERGVAVAAREEAENGNPGYDAQPGGLSDDDATTYVNAYMIEVARYTNQGVRDPVIYAETVVERFATAYRTLGRQHVLKLAAKALAPLAQDLLLAIADTTTRTDARKVVGKTTPLETKIPLIKGLAGGDADAAIINYQLRSLESALDEIRDVAGEAPNISDSARKGCDYDWGKLTIRTIERCVVAIKSLTTRYFESSDDETANYFMFKLSLIDEEDVDPDFGSSLRELKLTDAQKPKNIDELVAFLSSRESPERKLEIARTFCDVLTEKHNFVSAVNATDTKLVNQVTRLDALLCRLYADDTHVHRSDWYYSLNSAQQQLVSEPMLMMTTLLDSWGVRALSDEFRSSLQRKVSACIQRLLPGSRRIAKPKDIDVPGGVLGFIYKNSGVGDELESVAVMKRNDAAEKRQRDRHVIAAVDPSPTEDLEPAAQFAQLARDVHDMCAVHDAYEHGEMDEEEYLCAVAAMVCDFCGQTGHGIARCEAGGTSAVATLAKAIEDMPMHEKNAIAYGRLINAVKVHLGVPFTDRRRFSNFRKGAGGNR